MILSHGKVCVTLLSCLSLILAESDSELGVLNARVGKVKIAAVLPEKWTFQGCYTDSNARTLASASYVNTTAMTEESCISYCGNLGYIYAGTEYSQECCKPFDQLFANLANVLSSKTAVMNLKTGDRLRTIPNAICPVQETAQKSVVALSDCPFSGMEKVHHPGHLPTPGLWITDSSGVIRKSR